MAELTDHELLADFARTGAEAPFATLVSRHINLVHSAARRFTGDDTLAADITQAVFILLARKAGSLSGKTVLTGWLYQAARLTAANALKEKIRRQKRDHEAYMQSTLTQNETDAAWQQISPILDDAMNALREADRNAVLLRYFENQPLAEVGAALGVSEDAARVRVNRALDKLRDLMTKKGVTLGGTALAGALAANAVTTAPAALATTIVAAALTGTTLTLATLAMTTFQKIAVTAALAATVSFGVYQAKQAGNAREENQKLQAAQAPMTEALQKMQNDLAEESNTVAGLKEDLAKNEKNKIELMKLRNEVGLLKNPHSADNDTSEPARNKMPRISTGLPHKPGQIISKDELAFVGYATPEAALESSKWALLKGTIEQVSDAIPQNMRDQIISQKDREEFTTNQAAMRDAFTGFQIVAKKTLAEDKVEFKVMDFGDAEKLKAISPEPMPMMTIDPVMKIGNEWKVGGSREYTSDWESEGSIQTFANVRVPVITKVPKKIHLSESQFEPLKEDELIALTNAVSTLTIQPITRFFHTDPISKRLMVYVGPSANHEAYLFERTSTGWKNIPVKRIK